MVGELEVRPVCQRVPASVENDAKIPRKSVTTANWKVLWVMRQLQRMERSGSLAVVTEMEMEGTGVNEALTSG